MNKVYLIASFKWLLYVSLKLGKCLVPWTRKPGISEYRSATIGGWWRRWSNVICSCYRYSWITITLLACRSKSWWATCHYPWSCSWRIWCLHLFQKIHSHPFYKKWWWWWSNCIYFVRLCFTIAKGVLLWRESEDGDTLLILGKLRECWFWSASAPSVSPLQLTSEAGRGVTCLLMEPESFPTSTWRDIDWCPVVVPCCTLLLLRSSSSALKIYEPKDRKEFC